MSQDWCHCIPKISLFYPYCLSINTHPIGNILSKSMSLYISLQICMYIYIYTHTHIYKYLKSQSVDDLTILTHVYIYIYVVYYPKVLTSKSPSYPLIIWAMKNKHVLSVNDHLHGTTGGVVWFPSPSIFDD